MRGLRESASRGFWVAPARPTATARSRSRTARGSDRSSNRTRPPTALVRRIFELALQGRSILDISKTLNAEGIPSPAGKRWNKTTIHQMLSNETYTGTLLWGVTAKDGLPPVRVEDAFPAIISKDEFRQVAALLRSKAPAQVHPRRSGSPYLLSGLVRCRTCRRALTAAEAKSGKYSYYVCQSLLKRGSGTCETPRLNAKRFERLIVEQIREHVLTESNIRDLVRLVDEEWTAWPRGAGEAGEHRGRAGRGAPQDGPALARRRDLGPRDQRHPSAAPPPPGEPGAPRGLRVRMRAGACPSAAQSSTAWRPSPRSLGR